MVTGVVGTLGALVAFGWGGAVFVTEKSDALLVQIAQVDEKAKGYAKAANESAIKVHRADYWRSEVERQERYIKHMRDAGLPAHEIDLEVEELKYFQQEFRAAQRALSEAE